MKTSQSPPDSASAIAPPAPLRMLRRPEAAEYLGISASTLAKMALRGDGPRFAKAGPRIVVYDVSDLDSWLAGRKRSSTSDPGLVRA